MDSKHIAKTTPEQVKLQKIKVDAWQTEFGGIYDNEKQARIAGANTFKCYSKDCRETVNAYAEFCGTCKREQRLARWRKAAKRTWDSSKPFYSEMLDRYFDTLEEFQEELKTLKIDDPNPNPETYLIYQSRPIPQTTIPPEAILEYYYPDGYRPEECLDEAVLDKLDDLNEAIRAHPAIVCVRSNIAINSFE